MILLKYEPDLYKYVPVFGTFEKELDVPGGVVGKLTIDGCTQRVTLLSIHDGYKIRGEQENQNYKFCMNGVTYHDEVHNSEESDLAAWCEYAAVTPVHNSIMNLLHYGLKKGIEKECSYLLRELKSCESEVEEALKAVKFQEEVCDYWRGRLEKLEPIAIKAGVLLEENQESE